MSISFEVRNHVGWITLDRAEKLNALSYDMINMLYEQLTKWQYDESVYFLCMEGAGEKAFSAGGDVNHLYQKRNDDVESYAFGFFFTEYCMNMMMHMYPKPIVTYMNGIVMGGGVGVAVAGSHRIVNEKTKWAMPEMNIGLYPDVGGSYFLNQAPGNLGRYLALTSKAIKPLDVLHINAADYYMKSDSWVSLKKMFDIFEWSGDVEEQLSYLITQHESVVDDGSDLELRQETIDKHFSFDTVEAIINSLDESSRHGDDWAEKIKSILLEKSPTSLKVTLEQLIKGQDLPIKECLIMELNMSMNFMKYHDFFEGVRSVLVDKDRNPTWSPNNLGDVSNDDVKGYFSYDWDDINPLINYDPQKIL